MSYTITIVRSVQVEKIVGKNWDVLGTEEVKREPSMYGRHDKSEPKTRITEVRGYTPEIKKTVIEEREVLKQVVDTMDLPAVIKAINGLK